MTSARKYHLITASEDEIKLAREVEKSFSEKGSNANDYAKLVSPIMAHDHLREAFRAILSELAIASSDKSLTSQEAADFLEVSRPHLNKLLDAGILASHKTGTHRRVVFKDLIEYKSKRDRASGGLEILASESAKTKTGW
ncbi:MAG: hypothetical protein A2504_17805 [Bdellovibrionales bacterium RIFOXYD12_FULL_39_22]|nr:MAG: hypothetical protein A2385_15505 [Bdellovibrionales bacterium RIFOXYB1_FULL_39_21]OFZ40587.1 MAG: hypothetical protein A2485_03260 [Bdellovibrionales bacterium RIFOXYC12_FULL_39_17]OFZ50465.1 MAG: hypothetical protein A2404_02805 [Bdellovibrionales bacterium RIFOXYC1_FULL_39_130]OFZ69454.1 MAG: hypothetical protein A2451_10795 [Bdellovibrionales bacterium RIFOXYC2_FULL_39_8]OFZ77724.1 MAG: hypothetical protein A2560_05175 [Bdellovibrionales bacterium RIFOXYD1_FULL_39_84]OFZ91758.1 MAG: